MNLRQLRWPVVLVTLAVTLAGLFGAGQLVRSQTIDQPLVTALAGVDGLAAYHLAAVGGVSEITIEPAPGASLRKVYGEVDRRVRQILKDGQYVIAVAGSGAGELEPLVERLNLFVQEAVATGAFTGMADRIAAEAAAAGARAHMAVDDRRVYLTVWQADAYAYRVVERPAWPPAAPQGGGTGL
ncbi:hypothetical protein [Symbiobacterium thermophilum]|uniref:Uncharacterized protein n=1 Tax=Symbiobacterium thermophilum (strain DSM 24528 / JCM 14929 / IAM 14863 / T) TaxID=292459 RepID=Q67NX1_SYMTH|nr:hypothetical protein [Symbiobacterium thermophilum]BAD40622.1 conserved hypothetical protein [Symbiobacterium thermophilum IAM 14863]